MKLEVGMYVRTKRDGIGKIISFSIGEEDECCFIELSKRRTGIKEHNILKASYNIIDLIEEDDLIKCNFAGQILILQVGARYTTSHPENGFVKGVFTPDNEFWSLEVLVEEDILQSVVTKEQFESIKYSLEG